MTVGLIHLSGEGTVPAMHYVLKSGGLTDVGRGDLTFTSNVAALNSTFSTPIPASAGPAMATTW